MLILKRKTLRVLRSSVHRSSFPPRLRVSVVIFLGCTTDIRYSNTSVPNFWNSWKLGPTRAQSQLVVLPSS